MLTARYSHGERVDETLVVEQIGIGDFFYHADHLGSVRLLTDDTGAVANTYEYDAYGRVIASSETIAQPYGFTGRERDQESGLYYYRARYYDPVAGRFVSEDPIGLRGGSNTYAYVGGNPIMYVDPLGLLRWPQDIYDDAVDAAEGSRFPEPYNGPQGAYRHCVASCESARENGQIAAQCMGWINEQMRDGQAAGERAMDDHNNAVGRSLGGSAKSFKGCKDASESAVDSGKTINSYEPDPKPKPDQKPK